MPLLGGVVSVVIAVGLLLLAGAPRDLIALEAAMAVGLAIIEDDPDLSWTLTEFFRDLGYETTTFASFEAAIAALGEQPVHAIVADCIGCDHGHPSERDRARIGQLASIAPTVLHTARAWARQVPAAALGVDAVVPKPIDFEVLAPAVERAAARRELSSSAHGAAHPGRGGPCVASG